MGLASVSPREVIVLPALYHLFAQKTETTFAPEWV
jgi:hypothetical protein